MTKQYMPYVALDNSEENRTLLLKQDKCDRYDYIAAAACGAIGGMIDIFLVGAPKNSALGNWSDKQVDRTVMVFAKEMGWNPRQKNSNNVNSAIGFLEQRYKVNYDQRKPGDVGDLFVMAPKTHHMMSLSHSPDIAGLFFSILNQFTSTSSFISNGQLITISTETFELEGADFTTKIFCGITNWFAHIMSDIAGSSGSHDRGMGIVAPFYEFFGVCKFGEFTTDRGKKDLAELATLAYTEGYDFRYSMAQAVPVVITELCIRLIWALRQYFQYHKPIRECIPSIKKENLRIMLLVGNGALCLIDGMDAGIRSKGDALLFFMRMNLIAWFRFVTLVLKEVLIRIGIEDALQADIDALKRINAALQIYLRELEQINMAAFKKEVAAYSEFLQSFEGIKTEKELTLRLNGMYEELGLEKPWQGDFDTHMSDKNGTLVFRP
ncbi:MAG: hypothetical protein NC251_10455 [Lachnoclostridium sp.]|nr:hypothetical protein [Lachnospira sp.]MCM1248839.1 hypothetical protein [Lachnoclostridium sp.]MCM1535308.1 hypothetical protein [Clostridium sp.]